MCHAVVAGVCDYLSLSAFFVTMRMNLQKFEYPGFVVSTRKGAACSFAHAAH